MNITRCDRCGKDVDITALAAQALTPKVSDRNRVIVYNTDFKADLCRACMAAFQDWLKSNGSRFVQNVEVGIAPKDKCAGICIAPDQCPRDGCLFPRLVVKKP